MSSVSIHAVRPVCSFCGIDPDDAVYVISTPADRPPAFICDECVDICADIIAERHAAEQRKDFYAYFGLLLLENKIEV